MAWCLFAIGTRPEVEARVVAELEGLGLLASPSNPNPPDLTLDHLSKLPYLNAVIKETMRYHTVIPRAPLLPCALSRFTSA
jgi:cytochrome P450